MAKNPIPQTAAEAIKAGWKKVTRPVEEIHKRMELHIQGGGVPPTSKECSGLKDGEICLATDCVGGKQSVCYCDGISCTDCYEKDC
jgi:hypothetical protein